VGRKLAIQILEYFNRIGFTRRRGNDHLLRDAQLFPERYVWRESFALPAIPRPVFLPGYPARRAEWAL
jgi:hypothetical protein